MVPVELQDEREQCVAIWHPVDCAHHCPSRYQIERPHTIVRQYCGSGVSVTGNLQLRVRCSHTPPWLPKHTGMASWRLKPGHELFGHDLGDESV